jgi:hypothetical protein
MKKKKNLPMQYYGLFALLLLILPKKLIFRKLRHTIRNVLVVSALRYTVSSATTMLTRLFSYKRSKKLRSHNYRLH